MSKHQPRVHLVLGPVGAGKSTFAAKLRSEHGAVRFDLDDWMAVLFRPDRPPGDHVAWYAERCSRCVEMIWRQTEDAIESGLNVVLELGLVRRGDREAFFSRVDAAGYALTVYALDAPRDVRAARVQRRNEARGPTFSMVVPPEIFDLADRMWEPLDDVECEPRDVRFVSQKSAGGGHAGNP